MRVSQAKELFRSLTAQYFANAEVTFTRQSRAAKPQIPLVTITPGNVKRPLSPVYKEEDGVLIGHYLSRIGMTVDLFTHGLPVVDDETGRTVAYENTAMDDMLCFADFLNSQHTVEWCHEHDVSILIDGDAQDLTGLVNDNNYEFRSRLVVLFFFTQKAVGHSATLLEESVQYPASERDTESISGQFGDKGESGSVVPKFEQTSSGGGTEELAREETGYFTEVEIKEDKSQ